MIWLRKKKKMEWTKEKCDKLELILFRIQSHIRSIGDSQKIFLLERTLADTHEMIVDLFREKKNESDT